MWKSDRWKVILLNLFLTLLILGIVGALGVVMLRVRQQTMEHDEQLSEMYVQQQQQQTEARQESVAVIQAEYDKDMDTVAKYLPGIVCWGDSLTLGSAGNTSYPSVLKTYLDTYFCDIYDFRSTIPNAEEFSRLNWDEYKVSVPVVNMGAGPEDTYTILGRSGAVPFVLHRGIVIPADNTVPVQVQLISQSGQGVKPLLGGNAGVNEVTIAGIAGTLSLDSASRNRYYFTRSEAGEETSVPAGTPVETAATDMYRDYIHVVWLGTYGNYKNAEDLVAQIKALLSRQAQNPERFIVLGVCGREKIQYSASRMDAIDTAMMQAFGSRYINVRKYLIEDGLSDAGITPSKKDINNIVAQKVPDSFTTASSQVELNGKAFTLIGKLVYDRMESLGYFDEVFDELSIRETMKEILKKDPGYFDRIITNSLK